LKCSSQPRPKQGPAGNDGSPPIKEMKKMVIDCAQNPPEKLDRRVLR
jgi:hypothetical protein